MSEVKQIRSVLLPLNDAVALLPHSALAEIVPEREITKIDKSADWVAGSVSWNNEVIPLVLLDEAFGLEGSAVTPKSRLMIIRCLTTTHGYNYLAVRTTGVPKLIQATTDTVVMKKQDNVKSEFIAESCEVNEQLTYIPDMKKIEAKILN
jgi:chemosensory pili system protein ChpC